MPIVTPTTGTLRIYRDTPFDITTICDLNDYFAGDGVASTFQLVNKLGIRLAETVQSQGTFWNRFNGGVSVSGNNFTLSSVPTNGSVVVAAGVNKVIVRAYDVNSVEGDASPRFKQYPFYIAPASPAEIIQFKFAASPGNPGLKVQLVDKDTGYGASLSWLNVANTTTGGGPGVYQSATLPLYINAIQGLSTLTAPVSLNATVLPVIDGTQFAVDDFVIMDPSSPTEEQLRIVSISGNNLTVTNTAYAHLSGSTVYQYGVKCWIQTNYPLNASGGTPVNFNEIAAKLVGSAESRI